MAMSPVRVPEQMISSQKIKEAIGKRKPWVASIWSFSVEHTLIGVATILLVIAVTLALKDRVAAGSLVASLFVVVALFHFLPQMESFKAFGVEAKWRERLKEADEILRKLRQSTLASAQYTYQMLAWGQRVRGLTETTKRALADQIEATLKDLGVPPEELATLKRDYLLLTQFDLFRQFDAIVGLNIAANIQNVTQRIHNLRQDPENSEVKELTRRLSKLQEPRPDPVEFAKDLPTSNLREHFHARISTDGLTIRDATILKEFADRVVRMFEACRETGRVPDGAIELLDREDQEVYRHLFNE
jgi:hypothetical protein